MTLPVMLSELAGKFRMNPFFVSCSSCEAMLSKVPTLQDFLCLPGSCSIAQEALILLRKHLILPRKQPPTIEEKIIS